MKKIKGDKPKAIKNIMLNRTGVSTPVFGLNHKQVYAGHDFLTKGWAIRLRILVIIERCNNSARYGDIYRAYKDKRKTGYVVDRMFKDGLIERHSETRVYYLTDYGKDFINGFRAWVKTFTEDPTAV